MMTNIRIKIGKYEWSWDRYLFDNMMLIQEKAIPNKWDCVGVVFGKEGSGKTTIASQGCLFLSQKFDITLVGFGPKQFLEILDNCPEESSILWDEAIMGASAAQHGQEISQAIISRLTTIRKKRLKIILCFPYLHMLNKYFVSRCLFSIYVYAKAFDSRGHMNFYNSQKTEVLYELMKNKYSYNPAKALRKIQPSFFCKFPNVLCLDEEQYDTKKEESTKATRLDRTERRFKDRLVKLCRHLRDNRIIFQKDLAPILECTPQQISNWLNEDK